ncbi:hypothetical protein FOL47_010205 [Perkinsus chesapeaki]|uniref:Uncharacterized protein n=1 Tax=Perkinsus chesapeaki TaxID=330153 RepID=A0A7J6L4K6_PERCH|nr:hypothetical protein FOL47_010205 [Perkinsus chesapeaki]
MATPPSSSPAPPSNPVSLLSRVEAARVDIRELRVMSDVGDKLWEKFCLKLGGKKDCLPLVSNFAFVNPKYVVEALESIDNAVYRSNVMLLYDLCREQCGLPSVARTTVSLASSDKLHAPTHSSDGQGPVSKRLKMSSFLDGVDEAPWLCHRRMIMAMVRTLIVHDPIQIHRSGLVCGRLWVRPLAYLPGLFLTVGFPSPLRMILQRTNERNEADPDNTWALHEKERQAGYCSFYDSLEELQKAVGSSEVKATKITLATKPHTSPPKFRLICDAKENRLNKLVECPERIVLSRVYHKFQRGTELVWIGFRLAVSGSSLCASIPSKKLESMRELVLQALASHKIIPFVHALLGPLWKALGGVKEMPTKGIGPNHLFARRFPAGTTTEMVADASPWGFGGALSLDGVISNFFFDPVLPSDTKRFEAVVGDHRFQSLWESLAVLIAVRLWRKYLPPSASIRCRSDSRTAIGAVMKLRTSSPAINMVMAELAWECACDMRALRMSYVHISSSANGVADKLSRMTAPSSPGVIPVALATATRSLCQPRNDAFWKVA